MEEVEERLKNLEGWTIIYQDVDNIKLFDYEPGSLGIFLTEKKMLDFFWEHLLQEEIHFSKGGLLPMCNCDEYEDANCDAEWWDKETVLAHFLEGHYRIGVTIYRPQKIRFHV